VQASNLLTETLITRVTNDAVAGTADADSTVLDMTGYDGVLFVAMVGDVTSTCVLQLVAYENTASSTSSPAPTPVTGGATTAITCGATAQDNTMMIVDVIRPSMRYVFVRIHRTVANAVIDGVIAIQYRGKTPPPITQGATVIASITSTPEV